MELLRLNGGQSQELLKHAISVAPTPDDTSLTLSTHSLDAMRNLLSVDSLVPGYSLNLTSCEDGIGKHFVASLQLRPFAFIHFRKRLGLISDWGWKIKGGKFDFKDHITVNVREEDKKGVGEAVLDYVRKGAYEERYRPEGAIGIWIDRVEAKFPGSCVFQSPLVEDQR